MILLKVYFPIITMKFGIIAFVGLNYIFLNNVYSSDQNSFVIDYENNQFLKDGKPFRYISGSIHYNRVPSIYWRDRLTKMYAAGLNTIQTYIPWNFHEPESGQFNFEGDHDVEAFIKLAQEIGLLVIIRPGPYICGEWEMGGLPYWLLTKYPKIALRSSDANFLKEVYKWMIVVLFKLKPLLYENGGPIITVQVENEYGSYPLNDVKYLGWLKIIFQQILGPSVILFTTDGASDSLLKNGTIPDVYPTVDFGCGADVNNTFEIQRHFAPKGPLINSEYYTGWLTHWGEDGAHVTSDCVTKTLDEMLQLNASVNMYMFEGGTNFGFWNGANFPKYKPQITSYDYDGPLTEAGDTTEKYYAIQNVIKKYSQLPNIAVPRNTEKFSYGPIYMKTRINIFDGLNILCPDGPKTSLYPLKFEEIPQDYGFVLYSTEIKNQALGIATLRISELHDRGYVFLDKTFQGILVRTKIQELDISITKTNQTLSILVENQGRINYGLHNNDFKGIISSVILNNQILENWRTYSLNFSLSDFDINSLPFSRTKNGAFIPTIYTGNFTLSPDIKGDTFLDTTGWGKGIVYINGNNLGRYWPTVGPQITLYVPKSVLKENNSLLVLELEKPNCFNKYCLIKFIDYPIIVTLPS